ncbi:carbon-nitrogen hydrolase family protein [Varunaivibrio sulfuroxidans]|uniref:Putative amidohydrolase n=1 Tax=Varunaivibrio sulfuroxidans TaxID=1773489 RepID=A0A4V2UPA0_9PROT|nr:carbon-nitrogen hydrolase family protein [Varunaivibrio sulfuroxidans]TCS65091.1 putative amidohydrolase [Varunaivibrio sulfuroxidans]WES29623.1 carbon-nitrogen hydrolase family protein [Varunaivibrio sulfuroxidans]
MAEVFTAACVQVNAGEDMDDNIAHACALARRARDAGADFIAMPENVAMMTWGADNVRARAFDEDSHPALAAFRALAQETEAWILAGTLAVAVGDKVANRSILISPQGTVTARYDKIHMFDVDLGGGESYRESATFAPGAAAVLAELPWGKLGMSVCYDLRFPHLYRTLARRGADFFAVPAAFTQVTGQAHWHVLQRARAIENGCYVIAPAQCGVHVNDRRTYGHSLIVSPWGEVLGDGGVDPGFIVVPIDPGQITEARRKIPSLRHDRPF